jgi:hypothetical protein
MERGKIHCIKRLAFSFLVNLRISTLLNNNLLKIPAVHRILPLHLPFHDEPHLADEACQFQKYFRWGFAPNPK